MSSGNVMTPVFLFIRFLILLTPLLFSACTTVQDNVLHTPPITLQEDESQDLIVEMPDSSCSYFYLLWGTHAENDKRYQEAEEAFEKAVICDPDSRYLYRKLPLLLLKMGKLQGASKWLRQSIEKFPEDTEDRILLARLAIQNNELEKAIQLYREVLALSPDDETILLRIGFLQLEQNKFVDAENSFNAALSLNPQSLYAHLYLARLATKMSQPDLAAKYYKKALAQNWTVDLAIEVSEYYTLQKEYENAETLYRSILERYPQERNSGLGLVNVLLLQDKTKDAFTVLQEMRQNSNDPSEIDIITARLYLRNNNLEKAATVLKPLVLEENVDEAIYMLAVIRYQQQDIINAQTLLEKIESQSDFFEDAISLRVRIFIEEKQFTEATALLQKTIKDHETPSPALYTLLASLYMEQGLFQDGYSTLDTALIVHPRNTKILFEYGLLLEKENKREAAIQWMQKILKLDPDHADALNYIGYTWADLDINLDQALIYIQKAVELKPQNGYIRDSLGWVHYRMGEFDKASKEINEALKMEPEDPYIYEHLGDIYKKLGKKKEAKQAYQKAQELFKTKTRPMQKQERTNAL
jgi:tetratricopeptide (TPR) repeat protein